LNSSDDAMIERLSKIKVESLIVKEAYPKTGIVGLLDQVNKANKTKGNTVQVFDYNSVINKTHLFAAYINAIMSFDSHFNKAKNMPMEMLLFAAMTDQIGAAIEMVGAKNDSKIIMFANGKKGFDCIRNLLKDVRDFKPSVQHMQKALGKFGIKGARDTDRLILQKMAMSRLKS
jgi:tRNA threonylcarbamoyladenosine modification (KEOPS) complex Cgi121 subunit